MIQAFYPKADFKKTKTKNRQQIYLSFSSPFCIPAFDYILGLKHPPIIQYSIPVPYSIIAADGNSENVIDHSIMVCCHLMGEKIHIIFFIKSHEQLRCAITSDFQE